MLLLEIVFFYTQTQLNLCHIIVSCISDKGGNEYVARTCGINTGPVNICDAVAKVISFADGKNIAKMDCWQCDTDKCNSASGFSSMAVVGILAACFLFLF